MKLVIATNLEAPADAPLLITAAGKMMTAIVSRRLDVAMASQMVVEESNFNRTLK